MLTPVRGGHGLSRFYERLTGVQAAWSNDVFAEVTLPSFTLAIAGTATVGLFGPGAAHTADNHSAIIELLVDDVDAEYERLSPWVADFVNSPTTMSWGNRSLLLRDPDGNLINLFTPVTEQAIAKFLG
ncbi:VOC family protein [Parafrigoribacterium soli]|uniref:VOC family protein n=1 Tax=Parafrigoribacterium soli TaxID=3144663 RepID=UPI0032EF885A